MKRPFTLVTGLLMGFAITLAAQTDTVPAGTNITVRTNDSIDIRNASDGRVFTGVVDQDVRDRQGDVAIPRGANVELIGRNVGREEVALDLESVSVGGRRYIVTAGNESSSGSDTEGREKDGIGKNQRTAKYVGGGALLGTIIGAIAGGGKGAAIGAAAGGAAGAGGQVLTRGRDVRVPAESLLTFRLQQPLTIGQGEYGRDRGVDRDGRHYHDEYNADRQRNMNNPDRH